MQLEIKLTERNLDKFRKNLQDKLEIAAVKGWEAAVERAPAAGETPYSTGQLRQSLRFQKTGDLEYTIFCPMSYGIFLEFGTGPKGRATGGMPEFENDPQPSMSYHSGEVLVTRHNGELLDEPYVRHTQGQVAQPFLRPALIVAYEELKRLMQK